MDNLVKKIEQLIEYEKQTNPDISHLDASHAPLIAQIVSNYNLKKPEEGVVPEAQMIFLGAPTGAGKDTLVRKIMADNPDSEFVILNMDIFRHYHNEIIHEDSPISDKSYAYVTNQTSYELYYIIQELILREFPGTNVIITGTMRDLDWVQEISERYRTEPNTDYKLSLVTLAVPIKESAFSIFERYLRMVDTRDKDSNIPLRYTDLAYHNDTVNRFSANMHIIEDDFHNNSKQPLFDSIKVYRRHKDIFDLSEDTLIYDSDKPDPEKCAYAHIFEIMHSAPNLDSDRVSQLLDIIKRNEEYLKEQDLYKSILTDLESIFTKSNKEFLDMSK